MTPFKITISGELGSGKTALGKLLCEKMNFTLTSVGLIQRELAAKYGMSTLEFNKYMETHPEIDIECDKKVIEYGKSDSNLVLDSRLAWHFVPHAYKIHLIVNINIAANRIFNDTIRKNECNKNLKETLENIKIRKKSEIKRFLNQYNLDIDNLENYNLVLDTSYITPENLSNFVIEDFKNWQNNKNKSSIWLSPKNIYPLNNYTDFKVFNNYKASIIEVLFFDGNYFIYNGYNECSSAIQNKIDLIQVKIVNTENSILQNGLNYIDYINQNYDTSIISKWENMHNFNFVNYK